MEKQLITFDQLASLSFLRFGKLDEVDMSIIMMGARDIVEVELHDDSSDYYMMSDGMVMLQDSYIKRFNKNVDRKIFEDISGSSIQKYLDNLDVLEFVLKKIKMINPCCSDGDELFNFFSLFQMRIMGTLYKEGYIMNCLQDDPVYDSYQVVKLTKRGELYLFLIDNKDEIDKFRNLLYENGYNSVLIDAFLITQDLSLDVKGILTLEKFIEFFHQYDINPYVDDACNIGYSKIKVPCK